jgi:DNA-binding MarR family transcriptional regulator
MSTKLDHNGREIMEIILGLGREIRCCSRDEAICGGVTFHQFVILDAVAKNQSLDLADLHKLLAVEKSTTTRLVNPLLQKGLLKRDRAEHDSRAVKLTLTEEGRETHERVWVCMEGFFGNIIRNIPEDGQEEVLEAVKVFTAAMRNAAVECRCCE